MVPLEKPLLVSQRTQVHFVIRLPVTVSANWHSQHVDTRFSAWHSSTFIEITTSSCFSPCNCLWKRSQYELTSVRAHLIALVTLSQLGGEAQPNHHKLLKKRKEGQPSQSVCYKKKKEETKKSNYKTKSKCNLSSLINSFST